MPKRRRGNSGRTCCFASILSNSACHRYASGARTFPCSPAISGAATPRGTASRLAAPCTAGSNDMASERRRTRKPRYERRIVTLALLTGLPAVILALVLLWSGDFAARTQWTLTILLVAVWLAFVGVVRERVVRPLQTISNMLAALRERDFSLRARGSDPD